MWLLKLAPRSAEIQRLVGRALRAAVDLEALGPRTITIDCDVLQGDGGTRTASVTGGFVALVLACRCLAAQGAAGEAAHPQLCGGGFRRDCGERPWWTCATWKTARRRWISIA